MSDKPTKETVKCDKHGPDQERPCYMICKHVALDHVPIADFTPATMEEGGMAICVKCDMDFTMHRVKDENLTIICDLCFNANILPHYPQLQEQVSGAGVPAKLHH